MIKIYIISLITILFLGCKNTKENIDNFPIVKIKNHVFNYKESNYSLQLFFMNNPYKLTPKDTILFFINNELIYKGKFSNSIKGNEFRFDNTLVHCKVIIKRDKIYYLLQDKSVFYWNNNFKNIYIGFFPRNTSTDKIHFLPTENLIIQ